MNFHLLGTVSLCQLRSIIMSDAEEGSLRWHTLALSSRRPFLKEWERIVFLVSKICKSHFLIILGQFEIERYNEWICISELLVVKNCERSKKDLTSWAQKRSLAFRPPLIFKAYVSLSVEWTSWWEVKKMMSELGIWVGCAACNLGSGWSFFAL